MSRSDDELILFFYGEHDAPAAQRRRRDPGKAEIGEEVQKLVRRVEARRMRRELAPDDKNERRPKQPERQTPRPERGPVLRQGFSCAMFLRSGA